MCADTVFTVGATPDSTDANPMSPTLADALTAAQAKLSASMVAAAQSASSAAAAAAAAQAAQTAANIIVAAQESITQAVVTGGALGGSITSEVITNLAAQVNSALTAAQTASTAAAVSATAAQSSASAAAAAAATVVATALAVIADASAASGSAAAASGSATSAAISAIAAAASASSLAPSTFSGTLMPLTNASAWLTAFGLATPGATGLSILQAATTGAAWTALGGNTYLTTSVAASTYAPISSLTVYATIASLSTYATQSWVTSQGYATSSAGYAPLASPALTGTPTAPTASNTNSSNQIATTAWCNNWATYNNIASTTYVTSALSSYATQAWVTAKGYFSPSNFSPTGSFTVAGNLTVTGSVSKGSGSFLIDHPDPAKTATHRLRHCFVESPTRGDNIYRFLMEADEDNQTLSLDLPDYWKYLNENPQVWISSVDSFGRGYGAVNEELTLLHATFELKGKYNVLLIGTRKDKIAVEHFDANGVEFLKSDLNPLSAKGSSR